MILLDVTILVTAHREDADQHREIKSWLESALREPAGVAVSETDLERVPARYHASEDFQEAEPAGAGAGICRGFSFPRSGASSRARSGSLENFCRSLPPGRCAGQSCAGRFPRGIGD
jgi:hypothetical protein